MTEPSNVTKDFDGWIVKVLELLADSRLLVIVKYAAWVILVAWSARNILSRKVIEISNISPYMGRPSVAWDFFWDLSVHTNKSFWLVCLPIFYYLMRFLESRTQSIFGWLRTTHGIESRRVLSATRFFVEAFPMGLLILALWPTWGLKNAFTLIGMCILFETAVANLRTALERLSPGQTRSYFDALMRVLLCLLFGAIVGAMLIFHLGNDSEFDTRLRRFVCNSFNATSITFPSGRVLTGWHLGTNDDSLFLRAKDTSGIYENLVIGHKTFSYAVDLGRFSFNEEKGLAFNECERIGR